VAGWSIDGSVRATDSRLKIHSFRQWSAAKYTALPPANAGQYATPLLTVNHCCSGYPGSGSI